MSAYGCFNRPPVKPFYAEYQDGWTEDGRRNMVSYLVSFNPKVNCGHFGLAGSNATTDPECRGCRWQNQETHLEPNPKPGETWQDMDRRLWRSIPRRTRGNTR